MTHASLTGRKNKKTLFRSEIIRRPVFQQRGQEEGRLGGSVPQLQLETTKESDGAAKK
jgi:hypothetical protein